MVSEIRKPRRSFACSNIFFAKELFSYWVLPIPGNCAPWPGKTYACFMEIGLFVYLSIGSDIGMLFLK
jgi:hypothetical protein